MNIITQYLLHCADMLFLIFMLTKNKRPELCIMLASWNCVAPGSEVHPGPIMIFMIFNNDIQCIVLVKKYVNLHIQ